MIKKSTSRKVFELFNNLFMVAFSVITLYPFLYVLAASLSGDEFLLSGNFGIIPVGINFDAYKAVLSYPMLGRSYLNTILYTVIGTGINLVMTVLGAYPLARKELKGKKIITFMIVFTMFFSGGLIPTYLIVKSVGLYNTFWAMVVPNAIATYNLILMRTYFQNIPSEIEEAAQIDGYGYFSILAKIIIPLSVPSIATVGLFYAVAHWNSYFNALIYLKDQTLYPVQILLRQIVIQNSTEDIINSSTMGGVMFAENVKYAIIIVTALPIICVYPFIQRYFIKGLMVGSVKG